MLVAVGVAGCSGDGSASDTASRAASAASSVGAEARDAASSAASQASEAVASATAAAQQKLDEIKGGADAKAQVELSDQATDSEGRTTVKVTVDNTADSAKSFAVQVSFKDDGGNLLDTVVTTVPDVAGGESADATARSTHKLSGEVKAEVATALRY
ncbi:FxLYD domain-containing protein [Streptomyces mesophilus]|uniref:FxLYD domain-containing protein n=1 Tax=Streptomyces mesophilus TaxID=1775132 RepID=UPI002E2BB2DD|nr:FxLYD domain-containing protein [Streptomyces mesophilus]